MIFFHRTTIQKWLEIQNEGILFGKHTNPIRYTYLSPTEDISLDYGDVLLKIQYEPKGQPNDNYSPGCWQFSVFEPIPLIAICVKDD